MFEPAKVAEILKEEYGITTHAELLSALARLEKIDLAPFCAEVPKRKDVAS